MPNDVEAANVFGHPPHLDGRENADMAVGIPWRRARPHRRRGLTAYGTMAQAALEAVATTFTSPSLEVLTVETAPDDETTENVISF